MKTLLTLAATVLFGWIGNAAAAAPPLPPATANFVSERGLAFGLRLDGQPLTRPLARQVHVDRLAPGQHWADFSLPTPYGPPMRFRTSVWLQPGLETSYVLVLRPGFGPQLRQVGAVPLGRPAYGPGLGYTGGYPLPAPGTPGSGGPGGYYGGQPGTSGNYPGNAPYGNGPGNTPYDNNPGNTPYGNNPGNAPYGNNPNNAPYGNNPAGDYDGVNPAPAPGPTTGYPGTYPGGYDPNNAPGQPQPNGGYYPSPGNGNNLYPLPPADVQNLTQDLRNQPFDEQRLPMVKQALSQSLVRADELAELINTLSFDRSRIELAEYGYAHLSDPQNFYRVYDVLRYAASIREVQQALGLPQH